MWGIIRLLPSAIPFFDLCGNHDWFPLILFGFFLSSVLQDNIFVDLTTFFATFPPEGFWRPYLGFSRHILYTLWVEHSPTSLCSSSLNFFRYLHLRVRKFKSFVGAFVHSERSWYLCYGCLVLLVNQPLIIKIPYCCAFPS